MRIVVTRPASSLFSRWYKFICLVGDGGVGLFKLSVGSGWVMYSHSRGICLRGRCPHQSWRCAVCPYVDRIKLLSTLPSSMFCFAVGIKGGEALTGFALESVSQWERELRGNFVGKSRERERLSGKNWVQSFIPERRQRRPSNLTAWVVVAFFHRPTQGSKPMARSLKFMFVTEDSIEFALDSKPTPQHGLLNSFVNALQFGVKQMVPERNDYASHLKPDVGKYPRPCSGKRCRDAQKEPAENGARDTSVGPLIKKSGRVRTKSARKQTRGRNRIQGPACQRIPEYNCARLACRC